MHEYEHNIQKIEDICEEVVKIWIAQASGRNYLLGDLLTLTPPKVTKVESKLGVHEVTIRLLDLVDYRTIAEEANAWGEFIERSARPT